MLKLTLSGICLMLTTLMAAEYFVDYHAGSDQTGDGSRAKPWADVNTAVGRVAPGDTITVLPSAAPIRRGIVIRSRKGAPGQPITIDGGFNTFTGLKQVGPEWTLADAERGVYHLRRDKVPGGFLGRYCMAMRGEFKRMGRQTKWRGERYKSVEALQEYEWTVVDGADFYFRLPKGMTPAEAQVEETWGEGCGVAISGESANIVVRNVIARNFWNDGFNIHHDCKDIVFENIAALENADDGVSAHENCTVTVRKMLAWKNGTGFCHVQEAEVVHEDIYIAGSDSRDIYLLSAFNRMQNVVVKGEARDMVITRGRNVFVDCLLVNLRPETRLDFSAAAVEATGTVVSGYAVNGTLPDGFAVRAPEAGELERSLLLRRQLQALFAGKIAGLDAILELP